MTQVERWHKYWRTVTSPDDVERQLGRLHWLEDFAFSAGAAIRSEQFRALQQQIEMGEAKLAELHGDFAFPVAGAKTPRKIAASDSADDADSDAAADGPYARSKSTVFATAQTVQQSPISARTQVAENAGPQIVTSGVRESLVFRTAEARA
jgi:hypothetical protein